MIVIILSIIDIVAAMWYFLNIEIFSTTLGLIILTKGVLSFIPAVLAKYYYDWMGAVDILSGTALIMASFNISSSISTYILLLLTFKGIYSIVRYFLKI